jgi:hypothetical protein
MKLWQSACFDLLSRTATHSEGHGHNKAVGVIADGRILPARYLAIYAQGRRAVPGGSHDAATGAAVAPDDGSRGIGVQVVVQLVGAAAHDAGGETVAPPRAQRYGEGCAPAPAANKQAEWCSEPRQPQPNMKLDTVIPPKKSSWW